MPTNTEQTEETSKDSTGNTSIPKKRAKRLREQSTKLATTEYSATKNEERVYEAADMMRRHEFVRGKTYKELAAKWGVSKPYARELTAKAWRLVCEEGTAPEVAGATISEACYTIIEGGLPNKRDWKTVLLAARLLSEISPGLRAAAEHIVTARKDPLPDDPEELKRIAMELLKEHGSLPAPVGA